MAMRAPCLANSRARTRPRPREAPVTKTTLSVRSKVRARLESCFEHKNPAAARVPVPSKFFALCFMSILKANDRETRGKVYRVSLVRGFGRDFVRTRVKGSRVILND